jgi:allantoin racemase
VKIKVIAPITTKSFEEETQREALQFVSPGTDVNTECIEFGTASIESAYDEALCVPGILKVCEKSQEDGYDGVFISCMGDPGVTAARERLDIPVVGPARASMLIASDLSHKFSVVTVLENVIVMLEEIAAGAGLKDKLASVRSVDIPVLALDDRKKLVSALVSESLKAIEEDGAHSIIFGCTGMIGVSEDVERGLLNKGYKVPVVYPVPVAIKYLELLIGLKLTQSKKTYIPPPDKQRNIWERLQ